MPKLFELQKKKYGLGWITNFGSSLLFLSLWDLNSRLSSLLLKKWSTEITNGKKKKMFFRLFVRRTVNFRPMEGLIRAFFFLFFGLLWTTSFVLLWTAHNTAFVFYPFL